MCKIIAQTFGQCAKTAYLCSRINKALTKMKKISLFAALLLASSQAFAGGYLTNTNQSIAFVRNPARLATFELDGAYSNPAGLAWIGEGWHLSFGWQNIAQERNIESTFAPFAYNVNQLGNDTRKFHGEATAPIFPTLDAAYQKGNWTVSAHFGVTGGGGKATFNDGLPMFEAPVSLLPSMLTAAGIAADAYTSEMYMSGKQFIYGIQFGITRKIFENKGSLKQGLSVHLGARVNFASNHYEGYMRNISARINGQMTPLNPYFSQQAETYNTKALQAQQAADNYTQMAATTADATQKAQYEAMAQQYAAGAQQASAAAQTFNGYANKTAGIELDCDQSGWGIAPIIGVDYRIGNLNFGARYEFQTDLSIENKTKTNTTGVASFAHGVNTPNDIPALLAIGAQWSILPNWRVMAGWNTYFDKDAGMSGDKQKTLNSNTWEVTAGMEYDVNDRLTVSAGYQKTNYGQSDDFQSDLSFHCDSYLVGMGVKLKINKHFSVDAGYFKSFYSDYEKTYTNYNGTGLAGKDIYNRENKVFGMGLTWHM